MTNSPQNNKVRNKKTKQLATPPKIVAHNCGFKIWVNFIIKEIYETISIIIIAFVIIAKHCFYYQASPNYNQKHSGCTLTDVTAMIWLANLAKLVN